MQEMLEGLFEPGWKLPEVYQAVVADAWPGPLTILLPASPKVGASRGLKRAKFP